MDECEINGTCPEHSTCANTFGSFVCTCNEGFMKNGSVCIGKMCFCHLRTHSLEIAIFCFYSLHLPINGFDFSLNSAQMWTNVRSMELVQTTPPVQTPLALLYAPAMKDS